MEVKFKKLSSKAFTPCYAKRGDAGLDLTATRSWVDEVGNICYGTDIAIEIPEGYVGLIFPRSSIANRPLALSNSVGVIDSGYRGEITFKFRSNNNPTAEHIYYIGERIEQLIIIPYPHIRMVETDELSETERGAGGYGSSGK